MTHLPQFMHDTPIDDLVSNRPDDDDYMCSCGYLVRNCMYGTMKCRQDNGLPEPLPDDDTQPVVVTDADLYADLHPRDYLLTPNVSEDGDE